MQCKKCSSTNLKLLKSGPHNKLICADCLAFQKFLSKADAQTLKQLTAKDLFGKKEETTS